MAGVVWALSINFGFLSRIRISAVVGALYWCTICWKEKNYLDTNILRHSRHPNSWWNRFSQWFPISDQMKVIKPGKDSHLKGIFTHVLKFYLMKWKACWLQLAKLREYKLASRFSVISAAIWTPFSLPVLMSIHIWPIM